MTFKTFKYWQKWLLYSYYVYAFWGRKTNLLSKLFLWRHDLTTWLKLWFEKQQSAYLYYTLFTLRNPEPGVIRNEPGGENVYDGVPIDYSGDVSYIL